MTSIQPVRKEQHQNLKLSSKRDLSHIANQHIVPVSASEYAQASASFPVVLVKDPESERYRSVAMLGLEAGENLFYKNDQWSALTVPQSIGMIPFSLGLDPERENTLTACVDVDSPFIGEDKEIALFDEDGKQTEALVNIENALGRLYENEKMTETFTKEMLENDLLQELELNITFANEEKKKLVGIFTINEEKLKSLSDDKVLDFHKRGLFVPIYAMLGSLGQVNRLVQLRNLSEGTKVAGIQVTPVAQTAANEETAKA